MYVQRLAQFVIFNFCMWLVATNLNAPSASVMVLRELRNNINCRKEKCFSFLLLNCNVEWAEQCVCEICKKYFRAERDWMSSKTRSNWLRQSSNTNTSRVTTLIFKYYLYRVRYFHLALVLRLKKFIISFRIFTVPVTKGCWSFTFCLLPYSMIGYIIVKHF